MLFAEQFHEPIRRGLITLTVRRWKRPQARLGGIYRLYTGGFIEATEVEVIAPSQLDDADAIAAGACRRSADDGCDADRSRRGDKGSAPESCRRTAALLLRRAPLIRP